MTTSVDPANDPRNTNGFDQDTAVHDGSYHTPESPILPLQEKRVIDQDTRERFDREGVSPANAKNSAG
jgi:hypothetical protein